MSEGAGVQHTLRPFERNLSVPRLGMSFPQYLSMFRLNRGKRRHGFAQIVRGGLGLAASPVVHLAGLITVSYFTAHASRRVVGQWGGAGGAVCEDHLAFCGELLGFAAA